MMCVPGKNILKFRHIGYYIDPYGQSFFPNCISAWNGLAKGEMDYANHISKHIRQRILLINEPEPEEPEQSVALSLIIAQLLLLITRLDYNQTPLLGSLT